MIELVYADVGYCNFNLSVAILVSALLSIITEASAFKTSLLRVSRQLYGCTVMSLSFGNTEYV